MGGGGFDVVIGNPPWSAKISSDLNKTLAKKYGISEKNINICALFVLEALKKFKPNGYFGFLLPKVLIKNGAYYHVRKEILENYKIKQIIDFGQFPEVASDAIGLIIKKTKDKSETDIFLFEDNSIKKENTINQDIFTKSQSLVFSLGINSNIQKIIDKIKNNTKALGEIFEIKRGIELGQKALIIECNKCGTYNEAQTKYYGSIEKKCKKCKNKLVITEQNTIQISSDKKDNKYTQECISGNQLKRYSIVDSYFIRAGLKGIDYKEEAFNCPKILIKRISTKIEGTFIDKKLLAFNTVYSIYNKNFKRNYLLYTLGILNSKLIHFFYEHSYNVGMNLTTQVTIDFLSKITIMTVTESQQQNLINLVGKNILLQEQLNQIRDKDTDEKKNLEQKTMEVSKEIDNIVYAIYKITNEEKNIIEDSLK